MAFYIKVTQRVSDVLGFTSERNKTSDGNVLLWQADLNGIEGATLLDRAAAVGGVCLSPVQAKAETDGCENPVEVHTPEAYQEVVNETSENNTSEEISDDTDDEVTTNDEEVES